MTDTYKTLKNSLFKKARKSFVDLIDISTYDAIDENKKRTREEYYSSSAPERAVEKHRDLVERMYKVSVWKEKPGTIFDDEKCAEAAEEFWKSVKPRAQLLTIVLLLETVKVDSKIWLDFLKVGTGDDPPSLVGLRDSDLPLGKDSLHRLQSYAGNGPGQSGIDLVEDFISRQLRICTVKFDKTDKDDHEAYYRDRSTCYDKGKHLPLLQKIWIGEGGSGKVYRVKFPREHFADYNEKELAMKVFQESDPNADSSFESERKHSRDIREDTRSHASILTSCASLKLDNGHGGLLFFQLADYNLMKYMEEYQVQDTAKSSWMQELADVADALSFLHNKRRFHGDVKSENILVFALAQGGFKLKITDFGIKSGNELQPSYVIASSFSVRRPKPGSVGDDCLNRAPEDHAGTSAGSPAGRDIWGFGTVLAEVLAWFGGNESLESFEEKRRSGMPNDQYYELDHKGRPMLRKAIEDWFVFFLETSEPSDEDIRRLYTDTWLLLRDKIFVVESKLQFRRRRRATAVEVHRQLLNNLAVSKAKRSPSLWGRIVSSGSSVDNASVPRTPPENCSVYASLCRAANFGDSRQDAMNSIVHNASLHDLRCSLENAMKHCNFVLVDLLRSVRFPNGANMFHKAAEAGYIEFFNQLEMVSASDLNKPDAEGRTPLLKAISGRKHVRLDLVKRLVSLGADVNVGDNEGQTPLFYASRLAAPDVIRELLKEDAYANGADADEADANDADDKKADVNKADVVGRTPLHVCVSVVSSDLASDPITCVKLLLAEGADKKRQDIEDRYPLDYALEADRSLTSERWDIVKELCRNTCEEQRVSPYVWRIFLRQPPEIRRQCQDIWRSCNTV